VTGMSAFFAKVGYWLLKFGLAVIVGIGVGVFFIKKYGKK